MIQGLRSNRTVWSLSSSTAGAWLRPNVIFTESLPLTLALTCSFLALHPAAVPRQTHRSPVTKSSERGCLSPEAAQANDFSH